MKGKTFFSRMAAFFCAAILLGSALTCEAAGYGLDGSARSAAFAALEELGFEMPEPIYVSTQPESEAADAGALANTCIVGHSHAVGLRTFLSVPELNYIAENGMMASTMMKRYQEFHLYDGSVGNLYDGLSKKSYERIYVLMGSNDIRGSRAHLPQFRKDMVELLNALKEYQPDARICLLSIAPLGIGFMGYCRYNYGLTEKIMDEYNYTLRALAVQHEIDYLDITTPLSGEDGYLSTEYDIGDGLHFNKAGNELILQTILTHMGT